MGSFWKRVRKSAQPRCTVLVAAAGRSRRMGGVNKLMEPLDGVPVLARTLAAVQMSQRVDEIIVAAREEDMVEISRLCQTYGITKCSKVIRGGENRVESVLLAALEASGETELLAVHDGARPLVTPELAGRVIAAAAKCGAAAPALPVKDTVKTVAGQDGRVGETLARECLRAVQTPQAFDADLLRAALKSALEAGAAVTDDASAVERLGKAVFLVEGDEENLKITTPLDLILAEAIIQARKERG